MSHEITSYPAFESRFRGGNFIGSGGFAKVYKVFDHAKNYYVAIKIADVRPEWKEFTLQREVEEVNKLDYHRNIARYEGCYRFDRGMLDGVKDYAVLKFYEDGNLEEFLKKPTNIKQVTNEDKRLIIQGILDGVQFLHQNNLIHRDLKSQNILMSREDGVWVPKITDFGLSRQIGGVSSVENSSIALSFAYAAPEQIKGYKINKNVDLWAVGVIIYRIIAGELPFQADGEINGKSSQSRIQISQKIVNLELPEKLNELAEPYQTMIRKCLVLEPSERVQTATELLGILKENTNYVPQKGSKVKEEDQGKTEIIIHPNAPKPEKPKTKHPENISPPIEEMLSEMNPILPDDNSSVVLPRESVPPPIEAFLPNVGIRKQDFAWVWILVVIVFLALVGWGIFNLENEKFPPVKIETESETEPEIPSFE